MDYLIFTLLLGLSQIAAHSSFEIKPRIVNGFDAQPGYFPYFALLEIEEHSETFGTCGGIILSDEWILTAAHCLLDAKAVTIHLGMNNLGNYYHPVHIVIPVEEDNFYTHPYHILPLVWNDIALIKLPDQINFSHFVQPVLMPTTCNVPENEQVYAMGHGLTSDEGEISEQLQFAVLQTIPLAECRRKYKILLWRKSVVCAVNTNHAQSICKGDSGGGLVTKNGTLVGITSFYGYRGCEEGDPQGFTNIISYMKWIKGITGIDLPEC